MTAITGSDASLTAQQLVASALFGGGATSGTTGATPEQQAEAALLGGTLTPPGSTTETPEQQADAAIVSLGSAAQAQSLSGELASGMPAGEAEASQLVAQLAVDTINSGSTASAVYSVLSASAAYSLTKP